MSMVMGRPRKCPSPRGFLPIPRIWSLRQVAVRLGKSESWMRGQLSGLYKDGFPRPDADLGGYDAKAIEYWLDARNGLAPAPKSDEGWQNILAGRLERGTR
jgi:hypothetical protein